MQMLPIYSCHRLQIWAMILLLAAIGLGGCNSGRNTGLSVSGNVTVDGAPLADGLIMFLPKVSSEGSRTVSAKITDGAFQVRPNSRLAAGSYKVAITAEKETGRKISADEGSTEMVDERRQFIPSKYNADSMLSADITGDADDLAFALEL